MAKAVVSATNASSLVIEDTTLAVATSNPIDEATILTF